MQKHCTVILLMLLIALLAAFSAVQVAAEDQPAELPAPADARKLMDTLAADEMQGRLAGSAGYKKASQYVAMQFSAIGLEPAGDDGGWFQSFVLKSSQIVPDECGLRLTVGEERPRELEYGNHYMPFRFSAGGKASAAVAFVGYGIASEEYRYDDYAGIDVKGRIVLMLRYEPGEMDADSRFDGLQHTWHATFAAKVRQAQQRGAVGVMIVTGPLYHPAGQGFYAARASASPGDTKIPVVQISQEVAADMFESAGRDMLAVQKEIDRRNEPQSFVMDGVKAAVDVGVRGFDVRYRNVLARLPGADPRLKEQVVVIGAHLDHIGMEIGKSVGDAVYNGADDNASGVVAMLVAARKLVESNPRPARTILFIAFDGEEQGLIGSRYYVKNSVVPLNATGAMINADMVGRAVSSSVYAYFARSAESLREPLEKSGRLHNLKMLVRYGDGLPTDSMAFAMEGIPTVSLSTGVHEDYHGTGDTADKIKIDDLERIGHLMADVALAAGRDEQLKRGPSMTSRPERKSPPVQTAPAEEEQEEKQPVQASP